MQSLGNAFYRGTDACVFVYDITNKKSFEQIEFCLLNFINKESSPFNNYTNNCNIKFPFLLIGNKIDKNEMREVSTNEGEYYSDKHNIYFYETSALNGTNVRNAFILLSKHAVSIQPTMLSFCCIA